LSSPVVSSARTLQLSGLFDLQPTQRTGHELTVDVALPAAWNVGLIVGPSGCGKSTLARALWPERLVQSWDWPADKAIVDGFPARLGIKDITGLLCSVGFSSPPSWLKPFAALSTGEQFRVTVARTLAEQPDLGPSSMSSPASSIARWPRSPRSPCRRQYANGARSWWPLPVISTWPRGWSQTGFTTRTRASSSPGGCFGDPKSNWKSPACIARRGSFSSRITI